MRVEKSNKVLSRELRYQRPFSLVEGTEAILLLAIRLLSLSFAMMGAFHSFSICVCLSLSVYNVRFISSLDKINKNLHYFGQLFDVAFQMQTICGKIITITCRHISCDAVVH